VSNNSQIKRPHGNPQAKKQGSKKSPASSSLTMAKGTQIKIILLAVIAITTFVTFNYTLKNDFTNWDDGLYVETNPYIKNITAQNLKMILFHNITNNYYHPITMLTIAANYHFSKMDPFGYFLTNVSVHTINACIMFFLFLVIMEAMETAGYGAFKGKYWLATLGALCFGVHPMHVESVSWLSERKDVMYGFFYFLGMIAYIRYIQHKNAKLMWLVVLCYLCSLLSKPLAVVFPLSLFALDFLLKRDKEIVNPLAYMPLRFQLSNLNPFKGKKPETYFNLILEKIPFFIISFTLGFWAIKAQKASGAVASWKSFSILQRIMFSTHGFVSYIYKVFVPTHLCSYIPYPYEDAHGLIPFIYYLSPFIASAILLSTLIFFLRKDNNYSRALLFGIYFMFFNVMFVLQFIPSGPASMAERYTYIAYFGIVFLIVYFANIIYNKMKSLGIILQVASGVFLLYLAILCHERTYIWHNTKTLWQDVIAKYPHQIETSYKNLGNWYADLGPTNPVYYDSAFFNYRFLADSMHSADAGVYSNLGNYWGLKRDFKKSLQYYTKALKIDSTSKDAFDIYLDRAITYSMMASFDATDSDKDRHYQLAFKDYAKASKNNHDPEKLLENRSFAYLDAKLYDSAINDYDRLILINPDKPNFYLNRGKAKFDKGEHDAAITDFQKSLSMTPNNPDCLYDISLSYKELKNYDQAMKYALKAKSAGMKVDDKYFKSISKGSKS
jgi:protein O-mannosyl-transferase